MARLRPTRKIPAHALIIRSIHERGIHQYNALVELYRRGGYLSRKQIQQAGLSESTLESAKMEANRRARKGF